MPKFGPVSFTKLSMCHQDLQALFYEVIKHVDCTVLEGHRDKEAQEIAFATGKSKLHYPYSCHNHIPSIGVDVVPYPVNFDNEKLFLWFGGYVMGIAQRLKDEGKMSYSVIWGGSWDGTGKLNKPNQLNDLCHFQLYE